MKTIIFACLSAFALANKQAYYDLSGDDVDQSIDVEAPTEDPVVEPAVVEEPAAEPTADVTLSQYTFEDIAAMIKGNASVQDMASDITANFSQYYNDITATLPEVCEGKAAAYDEAGNVVSASTGGVCRQEYATASRLAISAQWQTALTQIRGELEDLFLVSQNMMATAYAEAMECKPIGCPCQKAAEQLTIDNAGIIEIQ